MDFLQNCLTLNITTFIVSFLSLNFIFFYLYRRNSRGKQAPIVKGAWPILGHLSLLNGSQTPHRTLGALADKYGPLFTIKLGVKKALVVSNWEMSKELFTTNDLAVSSRPKLVAVEVMSYNQAFIGLSPYGPYWRELRKIVTLEFLSNRRIEKLSHIRVSEVQTSLKELFNLCYTSVNKKENESSYGTTTLVDMKEWFSHLTFNMVVRMVVGKRYFGVVHVEGKEKAESFMRNIREFMNLMGTFTVADGVPCLRWLDLGGHEKAMKATAREMDKLLSEWLEEHQEKRVKGDRDFMDLMISALNGAQINGFDADTICKATTLELILGGTDSTAVTLTWALSLLLRNPLAMEKVKEEIDMNVGKDGYIRESDTSKLVYLQAIVKETLRLYPPAPLSSPREFTENCTLGGYHIKKGTRLLHNLWKIHRDPSVWSDPLEFKPERFLTTHKDVDLRGHHYELLPFGSGRRVCAGMSLGLNMVHFTLANLLHSFDILNPSAEPIDMTEIFGFTNTRATPLEVLIFSRKRGSHSCSAWPILGHLPLLSGSKTPRRTLGALLDKYGPIFTVKLGAKKVLVINNWEIAKERFTINDKVVCSPPKLAAIEHMTYNQAMFGFAPYGPYWRQLRKIIISEILSPHRVNQLRHTFESEVQGSIKELFNFWCGSKRNESGYVLVELKQWFSHLMFNIVLQVVIRKRYYG
ncbi:unnamed protein product [Sphenostylis stenocarpa]|uniref:Cytochrome P450 n=1 Tax=Sphenostylis stenocarpa TaxID=92480 RepID=A0AA86S7T9_9FABA|nr:unnamed protein product [Sphenostylis stenocarpa]